VDGPGLLHPRTQPAKAAKIVVATWRRVPRSVEQLTELPGIGLLHRRAIASISMGMRAPILDGNVKRVLARFTAQAGYPGEPKVANQLWATAERFTPHDAGQPLHPGDDGHGRHAVHPQQAQLPDLPAAARLRSALHGEETRYPSPNRARPAAAQADAAAGQPRRRDPALPPPSTGLWGGLWSLPELDDSTSSTTWPTSTACAWPAARPWKA
jgi:A/G-specific adenine glycosylase